MNEDIKNPILINDAEERELLSVLQKRSDVEALRLKRFLALPDLSRTPGSPIHELVTRILALPDFKRFDVITVPEIVSTQISFDLFDFPKDHPARFGSDTYFVDDSHVLRAHTTIMWYYYLRDEGVKKRMALDTPVGCFSFGKVYRKDEIDRSHMNVFHQIDGWYLTPKSQKVITILDLKRVLIDIARAIFGPDTKYRFNPDTFPYTDPSLEMEIQKKGRWLEVLGSGVVKGSVLDKLGVDSSTWNGWAFGTGLERLAMISMDLPDIRLLWSQDERVQRQLKLGNTYRGVSKYPPINRDISFIVNKDFAPNNYFDLIRDIGGNLVEEVQLRDTYEDAQKFGAGRKSYTYRIIYRSNERTLLSREVDAIQQEIYQKTAIQFNAQMR